MESVKAQVVIIGSGPGGISAAVAAARQGASVVLVERQGYLGGNLGSGLPFLAMLDHKQRRLVGGLAQEMVERLAELDGTSGHRYCPFHISVTTLDPFYARIICFEWAKKYGIKLLLHCELTDVVVENKKIRSVIVTGKGKSYQINADVFIDGTGDGDIGFLAGAEFEKGQADSGILQPPSLLFNIGGIDFDKFIDHVESHPEDLPYELNLPHLKPGYDAEFFRGNSGHVFFGLNSTIRRLRLEGKCPIDRDTIIYIRLPIEGEVMVNTIRIQNCDCSDIEDLSHAEQESHLQILPLLKMFKEHVPGFEKCYLSSVNPTIGVRETRRIMGLSKVTQDDVLNGLITDDAVGLCTYFVDIHSGNSEETYTMPVESPYGIPYGSTVSKDIANLMMTGRCISVDAVAFGSSRIMPTCMAVGEGAGIGAALAVQKNKLPGEIDPQEIRNILVENGAILSLDQLVTLEKQI